MKFLLFILTLTISCTSIYSQKTLRYSGDFYNGQKIKANASFSYYLDENNNKIKNGSFRYTARDKTDLWRYSSSITGNYSKNLKNGKWVYVIESKDYEKSSDGYYYNISTSLTASYINGKPNGKWRFKTTKSKHKKVKKQNHWRNVGDTIIENVTIEVIWDKGTLVDTLKVLDMGKKEIIAIMDNSGFMKSITRKTNADLVFIAYKDSIEEYRKNGNKISKNYEYLAYKELKGDKNLIKKKKRSLIYSKNCKLDDYLEEYIFMNPQFLHSYIGGDLTIKKVKNNNTRIAIKGMYYYDLAPIMTEAENKIINNIKVEYANIEHANWLNKSELKKDPKNKLLLEDQRRIKNALSVYKNVNCNIKAYKKFVSLHNTLNNNCATIDTNFKIDSKLDFLEELKTVAAKHYKILKINHQI